MKIGVFGGLGYVGSTLVHRLVKEGHQVLIGDSVCYKVDEKWFDWVHTNDNVNFQFMDIRNYNQVRSVIDKCEKIVNLSALVGETVCDNDMKNTYKVNYESATEISDYCRKQNKPMIFLSTCSNYGKSNVLCTENSKLNPMTSYSKTKVMAEKHIIKTNPTAVVLRMSTVFGVSKARTRMDIMPNQFIKESMEHNTISIYQPKAIRPIIHVKDVANILETFLLLDEPPNHQVYNVGFAKMNLTKEEMANTIKRITGAEIKEIKSNDSRTYKVDFSRLHNEFIINQIVNLEGGMEDLLDKTKSKNLPLNCGNGPHDI